MSKKIKKTKPKQNILAAGVLDKNDNILYWLVFIGLWGLIFFPPYFRGLFFNTEQNIALIFSIIIMALWFIYKIKTEGIDLLNNPMDWFVTGLLLSYIIAVFGAANQKLAVVEIIKHLLYFNIFWLASRLVLDQAGAKSLLNVIIVSATGVALAGLMAALGWIYIMDGFVSNRIYSTFQYPNTLASYLLAVAILTLGMWQNTKANYKYIYIAMAFFMFLAFIGTNSRGAFVIMPVVLLLTLVNPWSKDKLEAFVFWVIVVVSAAASSTGFIPNIVENKTGLALLWVLTGLGLALLGQFILIKAKEKNILNESLPQGKILLGCLIVLFLIMVFAWQFILPEHLVTRIQAISLDDHNLGSRIYWSMEAFNMVKGSPLFGLGGGAWEASYKHFQGYYYRSTQVHNDFAQTLMEVGYVGLFFFVGLWAVMIYMGLKNMKAVEKPLKNIQWAVMVAAVSLGAHAFIDFDFALSAVTIVLFVLFGITVGIYGINNKRKTWAANSKFPVMIAAVLFFAAQLVLPTMLVAANSNAKKGLEAHAQGNIEEVIFYFERARTFDPFAANYWIDLANFYLMRDQREKVEDYVREALKRDRYNYQIYEKASQIYWNLGDIEKAVEHMERAKESNRWDVASWESLAQMYYYAGLTVAQDGNLDLAEEYLFKLKNIPQEIAAKLETLGEWEKRLWRTNRLNMTPALYLYSGIGHYFFEDLNTAEEYFNRAASNEQHEALWWLALLSERQGQQENMAEFFGQAQEKKPEFENNFFGIRNLQHTWFNR